MCCQFPPISRSTHFTGRDTGESGLATFQKCPFFFAGEQDISLRMLNS